MWTFGSKSTAFEHRANYISFLMAVEAEFHAAWFELTTICEPMVSADEFWDIVRRIETDKQLRDGYDERLRERIFIPPLLPLTLP